MRTGIAVAYRTTPLRRIRLWSRRPSLLKTSIYLWLTAMTVVPMVVLVLGSLVPASEGLSGASLLSGFTFDNYVDLLRSPSFRTALWNTFASSGIGAVISVALGCSLAFLVVRTDIPLKGLITLSSVVPFFVSAFVHAFAWSALADPRIGVLNLIFRTLGWPLHLNINSIVGIAFVLGLYHTPFVYLFVSAALHTVDPRMEEAARMSGAGVWKTVRTVTLPIVTPAILSAGVLVFGLMAGNFAISSLLGSPANMEFVTSYLYRLLQYAPPRYGEAAAAGVILLSITFALFVIQRLYVRKRNYTSVSGKGFQPRLIALGRWKKFAMAGVIAYWVIAIALPVAAVVLRASRPFFFISQISDLWNLELMSLRNFELLWEYSQVPRALKNTLFLGLLSSLIGGGLYFLIAYGGERLDGHGSGLIRYLSLLPSAMPGMVLGMGYLWVALYIPLPLYGTIWVLLLSYMARFAPQGVGSISSVMRNLHPELEESARVSGAKTSRRLRDIMLPLSRHGILSAMVLCFVLAVTELHTSILLYTSRTVTLSVVMYEFWQFGSWNTAAALSLLQSVIVVTMLVVASKVFGISISGMDARR